MALVCKLYCSSSEVTLLVRKRPAAVNGGGFVVTDCTQTHKVVFKAEGCGTLGANGKLLLRDAHGNALLLIRPNGGMVEGVSMYRRWKGYRYDLEGSEEVVFGLKHPNNSCSILAKIRSKKDQPPMIMIITINNLAADNIIMEVRGYFPARKCIIVDSGGRVAAEIGGGEGNINNKDVYRVTVKPGVDQAFVCGVIAVLDNLYGESTACAYF